MNFEDFKEMFAERLREEMYQTFGYEIRTNINTVNKLQENPYTALSVGMKDTNTAINISLEDVYGLYQDGMSNVVSVILSLRYIIPFKLDIALTERLHMCGEIIGIKVPDHIIIGGGTGAYNSFRRIGLMRDDRYDKTADENVAEKKKNKSKDAER